MTELSFGQQSFLAEKIRKQIEVEPEKLWSMLEKLTVKTYKYLLVLHYNEPDKFKSETNKLIG